MSNSFSRCDSTSQEMIQATFWDHHCSRSNSIQAGARISVATFMSQLHHGPKRCTVHEMCHPPWSWSSDSSTGGSSRSNNNNKEEAEVGSIRSRSLSSARDISSSKPWNQLFISDISCCWGTQGDSDLKSRRCSWECKDIWAMWASLRRCFISSHFWLNSNFLHCQWFGGVVLHCFKVEIPHIPKNNILLHHRWIHLHPAEAPKNMHLTGWFGWIEHPEQRRKSPATKIRVHQRGGWEIICL